MRLRNVTGGKVTGTGSIKVDSKTLGGINIIADGTNQAIITIRDDSGSGRIIFQQETTIPMFVGAPFDCSTTVYYDVSGTGAKLELHEWIDNR